MNIVPQTLRTPMMDQRIDFVAYVKALSEPIIPTIRTKH